MSILGIYMNNQSKLLFKGIFKHWNHYYAELPYNLNWQIKFSSQEKKFLKQHPLVVCDIGARGSAPNELIPFFPYMDYHCFDADKEECDRLKSISTPYKGYHVFPYFIGKNSKDVAFNLYKNRRHSSIFKPGERYYSIYSKEIDPIEETVLLKSRPLEDVYSQEKLRSPDFIKLDTQGSELDILVGSKSIISNASLIEIEVEFTEVYQGQPLFHDVMKFMIDNGFELLYLNRVFDHRRKVFSGKSRGQLTWGDALFGRREDNVDGFSDEQIVKYVLLLINYGHIDIAFHLIKIFPRINAMLPELDHTYFKKYQTSKFKRFFPSQIDKLVLLWLHLRKYNQMDFDYDRSWPVR